MSDNDLVVFAYRGVKPDGITIVPIETLSVLPP